MPYWPLQWCPPSVWELTLLVLSRGCGVWGVGLLCRGFLLRLLLLLPPVLFHPPPPGLAVPLSLPLPVCHPSAPGLPWPLLVVLSSLPLGGMGSIPRLLPGCYPLVLVQPFLGVVVRCPLVVTPAPLVLEMCWTGLPCSMFVSHCLGVGVLSFAPHSALMHPPAGLLWTCAPSLIACCCRVVQPACPCADV